MPALVLTRTGLGLTDYAVRLIVIGLTVLLILIQYPLWLGKGSWLRVWDLSRQLDSALVKEQELRERNAKLASEVQDLKEGTGALEERARYELGLIKDNETFVQILENDNKKTAPTTPNAPSNPKP
ncbi:MAG: cell division protein FtsB [Sulfuritalea sp.]|jgi:cell division protein FtsB|nr:cell division protein FtsB [Sulfuritalea sp.]